MSTSAAYHALVNRASIPPNVLLACNTRRTLLYRYSTSLVHTCERPAKRKKCKQVNITPLHFTGAALSVRSRTSGASPYYPPSIQWYGAQLRSVLVLVVMYRVGRSFFSTVRCGEGNRTLLTVEIVEDATRRNHCRHQGV